MLALAVFALAAAPAAADERYVTPSGAPGACSQASPCDLDTGINEAKAGDTVHVAGELGVYTTSASLNLPSGASLVGEGSSPPLIVLGKPGTLTLLPGANAARLQLVGGVENGTIVVIVDGTASALRVSSQAGLAVYMFEGGLLRDSHVYADGAAFNGIRAIGAGNVLRNVTVVAEGPISDAIFLESNYDIFFKDCKKAGELDAQNVLARGGKSDFFAYGTAGCLATTDVGHSNYRGGMTETNAYGEVIAGAGNQTGDDPLLAADGFHQLLGSPTIDAGIATPENGPVDLDGEARSQGPVPDIGADEYPVPPPPPPAADTITPVGSKLRFSPRRFRPRGARTPSVSARASARGKKARRRARRSSRVRYRLSEAANVRFFVQRRLIGRKRGKRCVVGKRARRLRGRKCRRFVPVNGSFVHGGRAGTNRFRFSGYVRGKRLRPGAYRMLGVPTDAAGNRGRRFGAPFRIVRR